MSGEIVLQCTGLRRRFETAGGPLDAVQEATFAVRRGELVEISGASGSGKTTLLLMAAGLLRPTHGTICIGGRRFDEMSPGERNALRRTYLGIVLPMFPLIPYLNTRDNIRLGDRSPGSDGRAQAWMSEFGLMDRAKHSVDCLSAGECRRVLVARALIGQPSVVLADEPTSNLDQRHAAMIYGALRSHADAGNAVLLITHHTAHADLADRTLTMVNGCLVR